MAAIRVPIVSEFNKAGITDADRALQKFGVTAPKELKKAAAGFAILAGAGFAAFKQLDAGFDSIVVGTGATGKALDELKDDAKAVGREVPNSFADVGRAIADVNTRLGLTGAPLQDITKRFLDLSRITGTDVSTNIADVTRVFGDWSVATEDQAAKLDLLFAASQQTGIGVDRLSQLVVQFGAPLRQLGFSLEESVAMFGKFEKEGVNIETVMAGLRMGLGKMAKAGEEPVEAFKRLITEIKEAGTQGEANAIALQAFGQRAGPDMAAAIREGRFELGGLIESLGNSEGALDAAVEGTTDFDDSLLKIRNQLLIAAAPAVEKFANVLGIAANALTKLPEPMQAIVVGLGAIALASKSARSAMLAFGKTGGSTAGGLKGLGSALAVAAVGYAAFSGAVRGAAGDTDWLNREVSLIEKPMQALGRVSFGLGQIVGGTTKAMTEQVAAFDESEKEAAEAFATMTSGVFTMEQLKKRLDESTLSQHARNVITVEFKKSLDAAAEAEANFQEATEDGIEATDDATDATDEQTDAQIRLAANLAKTKTETERLSKQQSIFEKQLDDSRQAVEDLNRSTQDMRDAQRAAADATFALHAAEKGLSEQITTTTEVLNDEESTLYDVREAMNSTATSAADIADAQVRIATETATANGETLSAKEAQELWNASMLASASQLDGPMRDAVLAYIANVNGIPAEKITDILPYLDTMSLAEAERQLEWLSRQRFATVNVAAGGQAGGVKRKAGGPVPGPRDAEVPITAHGGEFVLSADVVDAVKRGGTTLGKGAAGGSSSSTGGNSYTVNVQTLAVTEQTTQALMAAIEEIERRRRGAA